jgi:multiple sugar transport system ATP-binding protein/lactose/L-arabinose transport system ATP-binding protein
MADVRVSKLVKKYGAVTVLHGVDLAIRDGEFIVFVGPSGSGKSTLLRCIAGLEPIASGSVGIAEDDVTDLDPADRDLAMVFQNYALFPHMSCRDNLEFPLKIAGQDPAKRAGHVDRVGKMLHIDELLDRKPAALSGGQRQRVAIGRAIVKEPKVFLFDEPLSNLDAELRIKMRIEIVKLHRQLQNTIIYVTHDQVEAMTMANRIVVLRSGRIEQIGTPHELYYYPVNRFVAGFIGAPQMNFVSCTVERADSGATEIRVGGDVSATLPVGPLSRPGRAHLGFRPEHVTFARPDGASLGLTLIPDVIEHLGAVTNIYGTIEEEPGAEITVSTSGTVNVSEGKPLPIWVPVSECHLFSEDGDAAARHVSPPIWR